MLGVEHCHPDLVSELLAEAVQVMDQAATLYVVKSHLIGYILFIFFFNFNYFFYLCRSEKDAREYRLSHISAIRDRILESFQFESFGYPPRHLSPPPFRIFLPHEREKLDNLISISRHVYGSVKMF